MSHSFPNTGKTVWTGSRGYGRSWIQKFIRECLDMDEDGGVFIPKYVEKELREREIKRLQNTWDDSKYNLNRKVLVV